MKTLLITLCLFSATPRLHAEEVFKLTRAEYAERAHAIWLAQMLGAMMGWQFEHKPAAVKQVTKLAGDVKHAPVDDDWYYEIVALRAFERHGIGLSVEQLGAQWHENNAGTWGASEQARLLLARGVKAPDTGHPQHNRLYFTMGNQARGEFFGMLVPAMPEVAAQMSFRLGHVNAYAEGVNGGVWVSALVSGAFVERDIPRLVRAATGVLAPETPHRQCLDEVLRRFDAGAPAQSVADWVEDRWHIEYPASNNTVANAGLVAVALLYGGGDFLDTVNVAYRSADFTDADNNAAISGAVLAAMHGMKALPEKLVRQLGDRVFADKLGPLPVKPPVDESISDLGARTAALGEKILAEQGATLHGDTWHIPQHAVKWHTEEVFALNDLMAFWNKDWTLHRAGYGAPGGGVRNVRGGTFLDGDILATYPRDEVRGLCLRRDGFKVPEDGQLEVEVGVDPGRAWQLAIYLDHYQALSKTLDGGPALKYRDLSPLSQPESVFLQNKEARKWQTIRLDLADWAGQTITLRLYQTILVPDRAPGNAYWRGLRMK